jgi:hypothetical protein
LSQTQAGNEPATFGRPYPRQVAWRQGLLTQIHFLQAILTIDNVVLSLAIAGAVVMVVQFYFVTR